MEEDMEVMCANCGQKYGFHFDKNCPDNSGLFESEELWWICKEHGEVEYPQCHKCVREDGKPCEDELMAEIEYKMGI